MKKIFSTAAFSIIFTACVSIGDKDLSSPTLTDETSTQELVDAAIQYGGNTLSQAKKILTKRKAWNQATKITEKYLSSPASISTGTELLRTVHLYQHRIEQVNLKIVSKLLRSNRQVAIQAGWQLVANFPSQSMQQFINNELDRIVMSGGEKKHYVEQLAIAIKSNDVKTAYSFCRIALLETGLPSFAETMAHLNPLSAANDFLDYLSLAPVEELRQLAQKTINLYTAQVAFKHFIRYPISINHPKSQILFLYAVSRNNALSDLARDALQYGIEGQTSDAAIILARLPVWIQIAFIEGVRRAPYPKLNILLAELRKVSAEDDVVSEISEVLR